MSFTFQGADVSIQTNDGRTPLIMAAAADQTAVVQSLVKHGADISVKTKDGQMAVNVARGGSEVKSILSARQSTAAAAASAGGGCGGSTSGTGCADSNADFPLVPSPPAALPASSMTAANDASNRMICVHALQTTRGMCVYVCVRVCTCVYMCVRVFVYVYVYTASSAQFVYCRCDIFIKRH